MQTVYSPCFEIRLLLALLSVSAPLLLCLNLPLGTPTPKAAFPWEGPWRHIMEFSSEERRLPQQWPPELLTYNVRRGSYMLHLQLPAFLRLYTAVASQTMIPVISSPGLVCRTTSSPFSVWSLVRSWQPRLVELCKQQNWPLIVHKNLNPWEQ